MGRFFRAIIPFAAALVGQAGMVPVLPASELEAEDGVSGDSFGSAVGVFGQMAIVGAYQHGERTGAAYLFRDLDTARGVVAPSAKFMADVPVDYASFGNAVAIDGDIALIGARAHSNAGAAYLFRDLRSASGTVTETAILMPTVSVESHSFGASVSLSGDIALVGASGNETPVNGSGAAYVFRNISTASGVVHEDAKLKPSAGAFGAQFGQSVSISGNMGLVGAELTGSDVQGSAYLFRNLDTASGTITESAQLIASTGVRYDSLGRSVSLSGNTALVGAPSVDRNGFDTGEVYLYRDLDTVSGLVTESARLQASDGGPYDAFGSAVSLQGSVGLVGASTYSLDARNPGAAYLFLNLDAATGVVTEDVKLSPSDGELRDVFGCAVSLDDDLFVIGARAAKGSVPGSGKAYCGSTGSVTTLDEGNADRVIDGISFESRIDWVIGDTTDGNCVELSAGDFARLTDPMRSVFVGRGEGADFNALIISGAVDAPTVVIGRVDENHGNVLHIKETAEVTLPQIFIASRNYLSLDGSYDSVAEALARLNETIVYVWHVDSWQAANDTNTSISTENGVTTLTPALASPTPTPTPTPDPTPTPAPPTPEPTPKNPKHGDSRPPRIRVHGFKPLRTPYDFVILNGTVQDNRKVDEVEIRGEGRVHRQSIRKRRAQWYQVLDVNRGRTVFRVRAKDAAGNWSKRRKVVVLRAES